MKKPYSKPVLKMIKTGTQKHSEIIALLKAQENSKQKDSKTNEQ